MPWMKKEVTSRRAAAHDGLNNASKFLIRPVDFGFRAGGTGKVPRGLGCPYIYP